MTKIREDEKGLYCMANTWKWRPWPGKFPTGYEKPSRLGLYDLAAQYKVDTMSVPNKLFPSEFTAGQTANTRLISQTSILVVRAMDNSFGELWFVEDKV